MCFLHGLRRIRRLIIDPDKLKPLGIHLFHTPSRAIPMPGEDALHVTELLKQDLRTSHIPIVLLTAKGSIEHYTSELPVELRTGAGTATPTRVTRKFINEFIAIVENNIPNEDFSVDDICRSIGISRVGYSSQAYFSTGFKSKFSITPSEYREKKRGGK
jgi:hypothetical protein